MEQQECRAGNLIKDFKLVKEDLIMPTDKNKYKIDPKKPSICMVGWHSCIRLTKMSLVLAERGYRLGLITNRLPTAWNIYDRVLSYNDDSQFQEALDTMKDDYDIFHIHNEPNALLIRTSVKVPNKPLILDMHDLNILRKGHCREDEILAITRSDAMVHVSKPIEDFVNELYNYKNPTITIESRCPKGFLTEDKGHMRYDIVYEGGLRMPEDLQDFSYRDIFPIAHALRQEGYKFHYYGPVDKNVINKYKEAGAICHGGRNYPDLLKELTAFRYGWTGFIQDPPKRHVRWAMTNKFFEYINCGTPPMVYNTEEQIKLVEKYNIGVVIKSIQGLREQIESYDWNELHSNLLKVREEIAMENHIQPLEELYEKLR